jgi:nucleoside-diphosphate-sugar epimerase
MHKFIRGFKWNEALPRILADQVLVYASIAGALAVSVSYRTVRGNRDGALKLVEYLMSGRSSFIWLLGPIFASVFLIMGLYTIRRARTGREKALGVVRAVVTAMLLIFAIHFVVFSGDAIGRSVVLPFAALASVCMSAARALKAWIEVRTRAEQAPARADRVLVLGGAGYIGSVLVRRLLERGARVRVLDSLLYGPQPLKDVVGHPNLELIAGDCRNIQDVIASMKGVGAVVHLAAIVGDPACEVDPQTALEVNYAASRMLIEIAKGNGVRRFIFASSCSVYGVSDRQVREDSEVAPISLYAKTKVDSEDALLASETESFHPIILRFATVFGLGYRPRFDLVVNLLSAKAYQEGVITVFNGEQWRPLIHVRDVAEGILTVLDAPIERVGGEIFNVGDSRLNHTLDDVAEEIRRRLPLTTVEHIENSDRRNYRVSFDKIRALGFSARFRLEDGIRELIEALQDGIIGDYSDIRYHNQRFIKSVGSQANKSAFDAGIMAVFAESPIETVRSPGHPA